MEDDARFRKQREDLKRLLQRMGALLGETEGALDAVASETLSGAGVDRLDGLRSELEASFRDYLEKNIALLEYTREYARRAEAEAKAAMTQERAKPQRDQTRIQELSEELTRDLRLQRVDNAIKELLDFLADEDFFGANASTGRRRRLRSLQNAIDKALQK